MFPWQRPIEPEPEPEYDHPTKSKLPWFRSAHEGNETCADPGGCQEPATLEIQLENEQFLGFCEAHTEPNREAYLAYITARDQAKFEDLSKETPLVTA